MNKVKLATITVATAAISLGLGFGPIVATMSGMG